MSTVPQIDLLNGYLYAADPTETYAWLRHNEPLYFDSINGLWGVSRYHDIVEAEKNTKLLSNRNSYRPQLSSEANDTSMISLDDPEHQSQRRLVARKFTPKAVGNHEERIRAVVVDLIEAALKKDQVDVVEDLAAPLPALMIAHYLGFGADRWREVKRWSEETITLGGGERYMDEVGIIAAMEFAGACAELIEQRRADPQDDMVSLWAHTEIDGVPMSDAQIISECLLLVDGGAETTRTVLATTMWNLVEHPDQLALLQADPGLLKTTATEEFIRWVTPILNMCRVVTEDHTWMGRDLLAGQELLLMYSSANRDEDIFADPETYDVTRKQNHHIAFGFGTHFCLGASLARLEIKIFFEELLARTNGWKLAEGTTPSRIPGAFVRGVKDIIVELDHA